MTLEASLLMKLQLLLSQSIEGEMTESKDYF